VLPVVFYTGTRRWDALGRLSGLVQLGEEFGALIPSLDPIFLNLSTIDPSQLVGPGGHFGRLLRVIQGRRLPAAEFTAVVREAVRGLEAMRPAERARWLELLSYLTALVYHDREPAEHHGLHAVIEESILEERDRSEVRTMTRSMADVLREEGKKLGEKKGELRALKRLLLKLLREKFTDLPAQVEKTVKTTDRVDLLEEWGRRVVHARTLADMEICGDR
jgi:hypothetical protein